MTTDPASGTAAGTPPLADPIISVSHLSKSFGTTKVLNDLSFHVNKGETFGLLGTNGSGKTTILRCLLQILQADSGSALINGKTFGPDQTKLLGYLPEERGLYVKETPISVMTYFGQLKGIPYHHAKDWSLRFLKQVGLEDKAKTKIHKLSGGQQQKVQLGVTIINEPELLILDEPTKGFDPINRKLLQDIMWERKRAGATIVLITHNMNEVEELCDRVLLLKDGKAAAFGDVETVRAEHGGYMVRVHHEHPIHESDGFTCKEVNQPRAFGLESIIQLPAKDASAAVLHTLQAQHANISAYMPFLISMDDVFNDVYRGTKEQ